MLITNFGSGVKLTMRWAGHHWRLLFVLTHVSLDELLLGNRVIIDAILNSWDVSWQLQHSLLIFQKFSSLSIVLGEILLLSLLVLILILVLLQNFFNLHSLTGEGAFLGQKLFVLLEQFLLNVKSLFERRNILLVQSDLVFKFGCILLNIFDGLVWILVQRDAHKLLTAILWNFWLVHHLGILHNRLLWHSHFIWLRLFVHFRNYLLLWHHLILLLGFSRFLLIFTRWFFLFNFLLWNNRCLLFGLCCFFDLFFRFLA